jgi:hypothetical protein
MTMAMTAATPTCTMQLQRKKRNALTQARPSTIWVAQKREHGPNKMGHQRKTPIEESTKQLRDIMGLLSNSIGNGKKQSLSCLILRNWDSRSRRHSKKPVVTLGLDPPRCEITSNIWELRDPTQKSGR